MAFIGAFIGINEHFDPGIRRLGGCKRDAQALHALFSDTLPEMKSRLLVDSEATAKNVRDALVDTLGSAASDDLIVFTYSGHGTKSHRLVPFDTDRANLDATTIPMSEIADAFRRSKAKFILCILDCCFSGGAPGRVLEDSPTTRDIDDPYALLVEGKGRYLLAACNPTEVAYENPSSRHGYLTKAVIDTLTAGDGKLDLSVAVAEILKHVRAETGRRGLTQTPTFLGHVEGGLSLPVLRRGDGFYAAFPDARGAKVSKNPLDLVLLGIPESVAAFWSALFKDGLNELQLEAVNEQRLLDGESLLVIAPTSSGKTFIGEMAAVRAISDGRKAVFLLPYKALVNEKYEQFRSGYGSTLGARVLRCSGDYSDQTADLLLGKYDVALLTYEMFLALMVANPSLLNQIGLVVIDEAQFITDPMRGISVELILTYLLTARERGLTPQIVALSAVIGEANNFDEWLNIRTLRTDRRPVPLIEGVIDRSGTFQHIDTDGSEKTIQLLSPHEIRVRGKDPSAQDVIVPLVKTLLRDGEKVLIFRNQRGSAQGCAAYLARDVGLPGDKAVLDQLPEHDASSTSRTLKQCIQGGTAFHNANLTREEREVVERAYRDPSSNIRVLAATTTVAAGINTPATTAIIAEQEFIGEDGRAFTVAEYKNMAGRAGRVGFNEKGRSIIYAESPMQRQQLFQRYVKGQVESLRSSFNPEDINTWIVRLLAQTRQVRRDAVVALLCNTYGGFRATKQNPDWKRTMSARLETIIDRMLSLGLLEQEGEFVQLTLLGRACGESSLSFESALRLVEVLRRNPEVASSPEALMAALQLLEELDRTFTPMFKRGIKESARASDVARYFGVEVSRLLQQRAADNWAYLARCKRACVLHDWIHGVPIEQIEQRYTITPFQGAMGPGDIRRFADNTRFHLRSAAKILIVLFPDKADQMAELDHLQMCLEFGLPISSIPLVDVSIGLSRGECLALSNRGVNTPDQLWKLDLPVLSQILGGPRASEIVSRRPKSGL